MLINVDKNVDIINLKNKLTTKKKTINKNDPITTPTKWERSGKKID
jgi:hypothetical protein